MKTTINLSENLLLRAKEMAKKKNTTLRALTEAGLRHVLEEKEQTTRELIRPVTFKGNGLSPEFQGAGWSEIRNAAYGNRG